MSKSALRVLEIMEYVASERDGCTHTAIAQGLQIPKSSLTALLQDLQSKGYCLQERIEGPKFGLALNSQWNGLPLFHSSSLVWR